DMVQALSLLSAYTGVERKLLRCSPTGILHTVSPRVKGTINYTGSGANDTWQGTSLEVSEIMIRAKPGNTGDIWVNIDASAAVDTGWPLSAGEVLNLTINALKNLQILIVTAGDKFIMFYGR
ncbi:hypothetical protein LCGC14_1176800, partial [marine sediment metagenome]